MGSSTNWNERGSEWNRWDPHIHAPGTARNDLFKGDWDGYLTKIEKATPVIRALGVTDYCSISTYKNVRDHKAKGRLPKVDFIFPNVELRLDIKTAKERGINIHLLFSPDDPDHEKQIERVLSNLTCELDTVYRCSRESLIDLGRKQNPKQENDDAAFREGVNQFKVTFRELKTLFQKDPWLRENCLVAVAVGEGDGTSGMKDESGFAQIRQDIERFASIIFSAKPSDREFWLGNKSLRVEEIEKTYGFLKPCLHGCDAHDVEKVAQPDGNRFCWIKGDLAFETLLQVRVEPGERALIGEEPPVQNADSVTISKIIPAGTPWLKKNYFELNSGLVSVIGARGSGKTALIDLIAAAAYALPEELDKSSFLRRATEDGDLIGPHATVTEQWADGETFQSPVPPPFRSVGRA